MYDNDQYNSGAYRYSYPPARQGGDPWNRPQQPPLIPPHPPRRKKRGAGTVLVPWAVIDMVLAWYGEAAALMAGWGVIVVFRRVAEPKVLGDQTGLSPILSLVGIYVGMRAGGVLGMVIGPLLLLVFVNLARLGIFRPALCDLSLAASDIHAILHSRPTPEGPDHRDEQG